MVKSRGAAIVLALVLAAGFDVVLGLWLFDCFQWQTNSFGQLEFFEEGYESLRLIGIIPDPYLFYGGGSYASAWGLSSAFWLWSLAAIICFALLIFLLVVWFAALCVDRSWQDKPLSPRQERLLKDYCAPLFRDWYARRMRRAQDRNPIAWLQQYSWKARLVKWGLCLAFILIECLAMTGDFRAFNTVQPMLMLVLAGACTFVGVNSFLAEKRSGALELILITPIPINKIILGRVWGLWKQFLPAALILAVCDAAAPFRPYHYFPPRFMIACGFLALPFCATCFALLVKNLIVAGVLTWIALLLPAFVASCCVGFEPDRSAGLFCFLLLLANLALVALVTFLLRHSLTRRIYSF